jgi:CDGSH-type Zn-finger protein
MRIGFRDAGVLPADTPSGTRVPGKVTVTPTKNGPLECIGPLVVESADGRIACSEETWLCRCGHSRTKPFCDGSHEKVGFVG